MYSLMEMQQLLHAAALGGEGTALCQEGKRSWNYSYQSNQSGTQGQWGDGGCPSLGICAGMSPWLLAAHWDSRLGAAPEARTEQQQGCKGCRDGQLELMQ